jgi:hypothetical protein
MHITRLMRNKLAISCLLSCIGAWIVQSVRNAVTLQLYSCSAESLIHSYFLSTGAHPIYPNRKELQQTVFHHVRVVRFQVAGLAVFVT